MKAVLLAVVFSSFAFAQNLAGVDDKTGVFNTPFVSKAHCAGPGKSPAEDCKNWAEEIRSGLSGSGAVHIKTLCEQSNNTGCTYAGSYMGNVYFVK